jgi:pSer/pThr/pTyr-binding forkhead associated (FHA) protein
MNISDATSIGIPRILDPILGSEQEIDVESSEVITSLQSGKALLLSLDSLSQRFLIDSELEYIGREPTVGIFLNDHSVSRKHAEITKRQDKWYIEDVGSLNGTYVNQNMIEKQVEIKSGDSIQIGRFHLGFYTK